AGQLDTAMGGPELDENSGQTSRRRSLYFRQAPDLEMPFLKIFDGSSPIECYERGASVVPQQALALVNSKLSADMAEAVARKRSEAARPQSSDYFVRMAFETVLGRAPRGGELLESANFLHSQMELLDNPAKLTPWRPVSTADTAVKKDPDEAR